MDSFTREYEEVKFHVQAVIVIKQIETGDNMYV